MNAFQFIEDKTIANIQRIDTSIDYEYLLPYAIIFTLKDVEKKFIISATNDGHSTELKVQRDEEIGEDYGFQFEESFLNNLKVDDQLQYLLNNKIRKLRIAEFKEQEIIGEGFIIRNGNIAGIELTTENHKVSFYNNYGGWLEFDSDKVCFPNPERWTWQ